MMHGLRECCLATALAVNPTIFQGLIKEFWSDAKEMKGDDGVISIQATVNKCKVIITEQFIRDALKIDDQSSFPTEIESS